MTPWSTFRGHALSPLLPGDLTWDSAAGVVLGYEGVTLSAGIGGKG